MKVSHDKIKSLLNNCQYDHGNNNFYADCPKCGHHEFGISLNENNHPFQCFRKKKCGWSGNIYTLLKFLNKTIDEERNVDINLDLKPLIKIDKGIQNEEIDIPEIKQPLGFKRIYSNKYLEDRGFSKDDFYKYEVGITDIDYKYIDYIVILIRQYGKLVGYIGRYPKSKQYIERYNKKAEESGLRKILRYNNSESDFSKILYGIDEVNDKTESVILVEGFFDKKNVDSLMNLDKNDVIKCLTTFKGSISDSQISLIKKHKNINTVIIMYDNDIINIIKKNASKLLSFFDNVKVVPLGDSDPGDIKNYQEMYYYFNKQLDAYNFITRKVEIKIK